MVEDKSLKTQNQVSYVPVEAIEVDPAAVMGNRTTSSANYESSPGQILSSLQTVLSVSLQGSEAGSPPHVPTVVPVPASQVVVTDLAAPMLAEPVSQQSVDGAAWYLR